MLRNAIGVTVLGAVVATLALVAAPVLANGAPITVYLSYLPEFSNHGPVNASGTATISIGEAWLELEAKGMPELKDDLYEAWITESETGKATSLGKFNADSTGVIAYLAEFDGVAEVEYRYLFISVEPVPDPSPAADKRVTIAGVFPNSELLIVSGTPTPTPAPGVTPLPAPPQVLPVTGGTVTIGGVGLTALLMLVLAVWAMTRLRQRRCSEAVTIQAAEPVVSNRRGAAHRHPGGPGDGSAGQPG